MTRIAENNLLDAALTKAREAFGLKAKVLVRHTQAAGQQTDARVRLELGKWRQDFEVEIKAGLRPATLNLLLHRLAPHKNRALLVADHVTPPMAQTLREKGIQFLDCAGNAHIHQPPVIIRVTGERPTARITAQRERGRAFTPRGLQVVLALLCKPEALNTAYRQIGALAGVAHGTVGWVIPDLETLGFVGTIGNTRKLLNAETLLDRWTEAYLRVLRPKLILGRYTTPDLGWWKTAPLKKYALALGGEPAAAQLTTLLRPGAITLYAPRIEPRFLADHKLRKDETGNVEILRKFWVIDPKATQAPLPVIYADLIGTGDARCLEAAQEIRNQFLARPEQPR